MNAEHPFAQYVRIIGRGPNLSRPLTEEEMIEATRMILRGEVEPLQLGAFLCVLRVRTEDPGETAGFIRAVREVLPPPADAPAVDLDWSSYAGKARHMPWFLLSALLLSKNDIKVFMHGTEGHTAGRIYAREALESLGIAPALSMEDAAAKIRAHNFAFLPLEHLVPRLQEIMDLKSILGLRSPINTFTRMMNPFRAPYSIQSIFHPNYREIHRDAEKLLGQPHMCVFKGEGGEIERRPGKPVMVESLHDGEYIDEEWPALLADGAYREDENLSLPRLAAVWRG
ncbi:MAG: glycosyl transferase family protein, partial [Rhodospirillales bacterium]|nr:glycosyl transferase family protein [Rhodospirillales bacterium]